MRLKAIHHVEFTVRNLDKLENFAKDFGLVAVERSDERLIMRTRGGDSYCYVANKGDGNRLLAVGFEVEDETSLDEAIQRHGARDLGAMPFGGGRGVALSDPDGNEIVLMYGVKRRKSEASYPELLINTPFQKQRFGHSQYPRETGPAQLWRLGHVGLFVKSFAATAKWYGDVLGLIGSDIYHIPGQPQVQIVGFFRLDRGDEYVDHHALAFMQDDRGGCHHISFEAQDFEAQNRTHRYLARKEYESIWGVGRHPHGSHVFDVWRSPDGARFETFSDTDLFRASDGTNYHDISTITLDEWVDDGPERYFA